MTYFSVLGPLRARRQGHQIALGTPQQRAVLALLLLRRGEVVPAGELVRALWEEHPPRGADGTVRTYVSRLRRALGTVDIANLAGGYAVQIPPRDLDLAVFRDLVTRAADDRRAGRRQPALDGLRAAAGLWTGQPLAGLAGSFFAAQRSSLEQLREAAELDRLELEVELEPGRTDPAELAALVEAQPLHERARELLILALAGAGRRDEALAVFATGRELLAGRLGVDPGPGLLRARQRVLAGAARARTTPVTRRVPAQLPPDLNDFTGRAEVLGQVPRGPRVLGFAGPPEVGVSSVAIRAAHRLRGAFPDGQVYADLRTADTGTALAAFLRAYGISGSRLPTAQADRIALWRRWNAERRVLTLLDHVTSAEQVEALGTSLTLITAHDRPAGLPAVHWIEVPPFSPGEGAELLERIAGADRIRAEPEAARRLVTAAGGRPWPIRIAAARIASRPGWTLEPPG